MNVATVPDVVELSERHRYVESPTSAKQFAESEEDADVMDENPDDFADCVEVDDRGAEGRRETVANAPARITAVKTRAKLFGTECETLHL